MHYKELDTPALVVDKNIMIDNLKNMQEYANRNGVYLRPHTKTHKSSYLAKLQVELGATGIAVAKVGEAEIMALNGLDNILIANEIVGKMKLLRVSNLSKKKNILFGVDSIEQLLMVDEVFSKEGSIANVLVEIEVGENRSGVINKDDYINILHFINSRDSICFMGIFSHDGNSYSAKDKDQCLEIHLESQRRTLEFAEIAKSMGMNPSIVSVGSTPSLINDFPILEGITEIRPGTYIFMDAAQANAYGDLSKNAAWVTTTVISKPTDDRVITDVGAKGLTMQTRTNGFTQTKGMGIIKDFKNAYIHQVYDEHAIIYNKEIRDSIKIGDVIDVIPNHICPVVNLHESIYLINQGIVESEIPVDCRGKLK